MTPRITHLARVLVIYGLLLGGGLVFSLPFLWMVGTSFKVDREMFGEKIAFWPMRPAPATSSPYLDERYFAKPRSPRWEQARDLVEAKVGPVLAPGVFTRLEDTLPNTFWQGDWAPELARHITDDLLQEVRQKIERRFTFGAVRVRSYDLQEVDMTTGAPVSQFWTVEGPARLVDFEESGVPVADLAYEFAQQRGGEIRLTKRLALPFTVDRLHRIQIFLRPDDSWHRAEFYVEKNGKRYKGQRPEFLGNFQWTTVTLQDYGEDDTSTKIRLWIPLVADSTDETSVEAGHAPSPQDAPVKLTIVIRQSSQLEAWWAKMQRNYTGALNYIPFWRYVSTSVFLVILNIVGTVLSCSLVAFSFSRLHWPGRDFSFGLMMATMMIPGQVTMIPYFLIIKSLGWYNTLTPLWVVSFCGNAFNIFLLRQFMKGIPRDLEDAARIDGCNSMQVYWHVIMPLIKPTLACISIFTFMGVWNDFMGPLIYLSDQRLYPLSLGLYAFNVQAGGNFGMMMAGSLLMTLPVVAIFFFAQKYFIQGVTLTGMKG
jgi:ABC-type glycerol-3-phosphate transport system permease component